MLIDTHCHIHFRAYDQDREEVIRRTLREGVQMITVGTNLATSEDAVHLAMAHDGIWATVGLHPNHLFPGPVDPDEESVMSVETFEIERYREAARKSKVVAIGECGLDYFRLPATLTPSLSPQGRGQKEVFRAHLDLADELNLPVIIHCRDAHADLARILKEYLAAGKLKRRGVIHCFTGSQNEAETYLPLGFFISFTGIITFPPRKNQTEMLADVVRAVPLDRILIETDAPYLSPVPHRGKRNEPAYVKFVAEKIAKIKEIPYDEVASQTSNNANQLLKLRS